jgi:hypothetical protein
LRECDPKGFVFSVVRGPRHRHALFRALSMIPIVPHCTLPD